MNIFALIFAIASIVVALCAHFAVPRRWATVALALALAVTAWVLAAVIAAGPVVGGVG